MLVVHGWVYLTGSIRYFHSSSCSLLNIHFELVFSAQEWPWWTALASTQASLTWRSWCGFWLTCNRLVKTKQKDIFAFNCLLQTFPLKLGVCETYISPLLHQVDLFVVTFKYGDRFSPELGRSIIWNYSDQEFWGKYIFCKKKHDSGPWRLSANYWGAFGGTRWDWLVLLLK